MRNWLPRFSISRKMISIIFLNVSLIAAAIFNHIYKVTHDAILSNLKESSRLLTFSTVHEVEKNLIAVQKVADNLAVTIQKRYKSNDDLEKLLIMAVESNPEILGAAIALEPGRKGQPFGTLYVGRRRDALYKTYTDPGNYDDHIRDWYLIPKELKRALWSEPYYDEVMPDIKKVTYSVPIYENRDGTSRFVGILAADLSLEWLDNLVSSIKVCQTGYAYMISRNGSIISHPNKDYILNATIFSLAEEAASPVLDEIGRNMVRGRSSFADVEYLVRGKRSWLTYAPVAVSGWSLGIVYPVDELTAPLNDLSKTVMVFALFGAVILLLVIVLISRSITRPLRKLAFATRQISGGNFDAALPLVKTRDEIGDLTKSFEVMQRELRNAIKEHDRLCAIQCDLETARAIQFGILPKKFPPFPDRSEFDIFAAMEPATQVGGDLYDFFLLDSDHVGLVIGDVSGKGVPAAIFMAVSRTSMRATALKGIPPDECLSYVNDLLCQDSVGSMFVSMFYGVLDFNTGEMIYADGGHCPPYILSRNGDLRVLESTGMVLGLMAGRKYNCNKLNLAPGDTFFGYTDGVTEATNAEESQFSEERLERFLCDNRSLDTTTLVRACLSDVHNFAGGAEQSDDITILAVRWETPAR